MSTDDQKNQFTTLHIAHEDNRLKQILQKHKRVFRQSEHDIGRITVAKHSIKTTPHPPIQLRAYRRPQSDYDEIRKQVELLKSNHHIRDSDSPWAFPVTLADKKDGTKRLCIDYRKLNLITIDDKMPIPRITEVLDRLQGAKYFTTLDVAWGYWHIEMDPDSIDKTAFVTNEGHYEWLVMPFGLKNAPATFQRIIQRILGKLLYNGVINYLDDFIIYSESFESHLRLINEVLGLLEAHNIKLKLSKCTFAKTQVIYLGHSISHNEVRPSPEKIAALKSYPIPDTLRKVRQFLGLAQYYRRFIPNFTKLAKPLTDLTRKDNAFDWQSPQQNAFDELIKALTSPPVLTLFDPTKPCRIYTDASKIGIGATLAQTDEQGIEHVIEYFSRRLQPCQENYTAAELECFAIVESIEHFEVYLNLPFTVITDHSALQWLLTLKKAKGRLYRWSVKLSTYTFKIIHKAGKSQQHVDALSRSPISMHLTPEELIESQSKADLSFVRKLIDRKGIKMIKHGILFKAIVPPDLRYKLLEFLHEKLSHPGKNKLLKLITPYYWWPNIHQDIRKHVQSCKACQLTKYPNKPTPGVYIQPNANLEPYDMVGIDTIVMGPASNNTKQKYIQVLIDHHTRFIWAYATASNKCETIVNILTNLKNSGINFRTILTDCHKNFTGRALKTFCTENNIKHIFSTPYHPQTNGIVEKANGTIITKLRLALLDKPTRKWTTLLKEVIIDYNNTPHDTTGFTPNFLLFGSNNIPSFGESPISFEEARQIAKQRTLASQIKHKRIHDSKHMPLVFHPGDRVIRRIPDNHPTLNKTSPRWSGPYYILKRIIDNTYDISSTLSGEPFRAHVSQLKPFVPREQTQRPEESVTECVS